MKGQALSFLRMNLIALRRAIDGERQDEDLAEPLADMLASISIMATAYEFDLEAMNARRKLVMVQFDKDHGDSNSFPICEEKQT